MKMEQIEGSETSAIRTKTPGNYPKENILHINSLFTYRGQLEKDLALPDAHQKVKVHVAVSEQLT